METEKQTKINKERIYGVSVVVFLFIVAVLSVCVVFGVITPTALLASLGADRSRCMNVDGCFSFCNVGNGDSTLIYTNNVIGMVDFGVADYSYSLSDKVRELTDDPLDFAVISHPHSDHAGGFEVLAKTVGITRLYMRKYSENELEDYQFYQDILSVAESNGVQVIHPASGTQIRYDTIDLNFYYHNLYTKEENENCLVTMASIGDTRCLLMGDSGHLTEDVLLEQVTDLKADILKIGHHGSKSATSERFLHAIDPDYGVICVGRNSYGHPSPEVTSLLRRYEITFYRTDGYQQIIFMIKDSKISLLTI